jgi:hypothetical protein
MQGCKRALWNGTGDFVTLGQDGQNKKEHQREHNPFQAFHPTGFPHVSCGINPLRMFDFARRS